MTNLTKSMPFFKFINQSVKAGVAGVAEAWKYFFKHELQFVPPITIRSKQNDI